MIKRFEHGGNIYEAPPPGKVWLDFSANINPLGLSPAVKEAMTAHMGTISYKEGRRTYWDKEKEVIV